MTSHNVKKMSNRHSSLHLVPKEANDISKNKQQFLKEIQNHGKKVYKTKENMRELIDIMEIPQFQDFFSKHFNNWDDIHTVTILMLSIKYIEDYNDIYNTQNTKLNKFQKIGMLDNILSDSKQRKLLFQHFTDKLVLEAKKDYAITGNPSYEDNKS